MNEFKVGDTVVVLSGGWGVQLSKPFTITKQHKNGNLVVGGEQYRPNGWRAGEDWHRRGSLVLVGSDEHTRLMGEVRRERAQSALKDAMDRIRKDLTAVELESLVAVLEQYTTPKEPKP